MRKMTPLILALTFGLSSDALGFSSADCYQSGPYKIVRGINLIDNSIGLDVASAEKGVNMLPSIECAANIVVPFEHNKSNFLVFNLMGADETSCTYSRLLAKIAKPPAEFVEFNIVCRKP